MSQTQTQVVSAEKSELKLDLAELKTVKWIGSVGAVKQSYDVTSTKYNSVKGNSKIFTWILAPFEIVVISFYLFIHQLPWPNWFLEIMFKVDLVIESILESIGDKIDWWCDVVMVRLMRFRDSVESFIDAVLSFALYIVYQGLNFVLALFNLTLRYLKWWFTPITWIFNQILPKEKALNLTTSPSQNGISEIKLPIKTKSVDTNVYDNVDISSKSSDYESDVSAVSESWSLGHTDKSGKSYNRVDLKVMAEGRLRAAMYKRVKGQLSLMRKNSISFSKGMTAYARKFLEPQVSPLLATLKNWILQFVVKHDLLSTYEKIVSWINAHPIIDKFVSLAVLIMMIPVNFIHRFSAHGKRKSRRTRSMRSESLRRRTGAVACEVTPVSHEPFGLSQSAEPLVEEQEFVTLRKLRRNSLKEQNEDETMRDSLKEENEEETDTMRDSALASSIDDLCHVSDGCESPSQDLKGQTIEEETKGETTTPVKTTEDSGISEEQSNPPTPKISARTKTEWNELQIKNDIPPPQYKAFEKPRKSLTNPNLFAKVTKTSSEENIYAKNQSGGPQKPPKRKISFSLT